MSSKTANVNYDMGCDEAVEVATVKQRKARKKHFLNYGNTC
jgi:hypothetical protein